MPQAWTLIRTQPASGWGIGRSTISNGPFGRAICAARIFGIITSVVVSSLRLNSNRRIAPTYPRRGARAVAPAVPVDHQPLRPQRRSDHDEPLTDPNGNRFGAASGVELGENGSDVELDGVLRNTEARRDDLVAEPLGNYAEDLDLAWRERLVGDRDAGSLTCGVHWLERLQGVGVNHDEAGRDRLDGGDEFLRGRVSGQHRAPHGPERLGAEDGAGIIREDDDGGRPRRGAEAVEPGGGALDAEIEEQHVGLGSLDLLG